MKTWPICPTFCLLALLLLLPARAQDADSPKPAPKSFDPKAAEVLRKSAAFYHGLKSYRLDLKVQMSLQMQAMRQERNMDYQVALRRPNFYALRLQEGMGASVISNGEKLFVHVPMLRRYTEQPAPKGFPSILKAGEMGGMATRPTPTLDALMALEPYENVIREVQKLTYIGLEKVGDLECHRLQVTDAFLWDMYIQTGDQPLVIKISGDLSEMMKNQMAAAGGNPEMAKMIKDLKMEAEMAYNNWEVNPKLPDSVFQFDPPQGTEKVTSFADAVEEAEEEHELLGEPAPRFALEQLGGGKLSLDDQIGKKVIILDFWATWCGPCVKALPVLSEVMQSFKGRDVAFYGINQREEERVIRKFLKDKNLNFEVLLDRDGAIAELYQVEGIPQTVIIDKKGVIQAVHVGFSPHLQEQLTGELEALLAGKSLVEVDEGALEKEAPQKETK